MHSFTCDYSQTLCLIIIHLSIHTKSYIARIFADNVLTPECQVWLYQLV